MQLDGARGYGLKAELDATEASNARSLPSVEADWRQAVTANPKSYEAYIGLSRCLLAGGSNKLKEAEDEAKKALALDPARIDSYRLLAATYVITARWDQLDAALRNARNAVPDDLTAEFVAGETILDRNMGSQWTRAEEHFRNYLKMPNEGLEPTMAMAHWKLGTLLEREGRKSAALKELETAVSLDPSLDEAQKTLKKLQ